MNGRPGDHPLTDILWHSTRVFSERADGLIREIAGLGGKEQLERAFSLLNPPPLPEFEGALERMRNELRSEALQRGREIPEG